MPYVSDAQRRFAHTKKGKKQFGAKNVAEFDAASKGMALPERAPARKAKSARDLFHKRTPSKP